MSYSQFASWLWVAASVVLLIANVATLLGQYKGWK